MVETEVLLPLSTAHLTQATAGLFEMQTDDLPVFYPKGDYGWFIPVPQPDRHGLEIPSTCPPDLRACIEFARARGAQWLMFDRDAGEVDELPSHDW